MKVFLINLDRSTERLAVMRNRLASINVTAERVSGIEGAKLDLNSIDMDVPNPNYPRLLTAGEIGCFLSHRKCWEKLVESGDDWALILEDDCIFHPASSRYLTSVEWIPEGCQLIHFYNTKAKVYTDKQINLPDGNCLFRAKVSLPVGAYAYCISKDAARKALELSTSIREPVDNFLFGVFSPFPRCIDSWRLEGAVLEPCEEVQSTIPGRKAKQFSWYQLHPLRLLNKLKIKWQRRTLQTIHHYLLKD